jgi:hypothetical protein
MYKKLLLWANYIEERACVSRKYWRHHTNSLSLANFVGSVVGFLNVLIIRLRSLLLAATLSFEIEMVSDVVYFRHIIFDLPETGQRPRPD